MARMARRFNVPPGWPSLPTSDWMPPAGWSPDPAWPAPPPDWIFYTDVPEAGGSAAWVEPLLTVSAVCWSHRTARHRPSEKDTQQDKGALVSPDTGSTRRDDALAQAADDEGQAGHRVLAGEVLSRDLVLTREDRAEGIRQAYAKYTQMYLSDNGRIWATAATMIPLSLGAFVVLVSIEEPSVFQVGILAMASWLLMALWYVIAENHRAFQDVWLQQTIKIEQLWGLNPPDRPRAAAVRIVGRGVVRRTRVVLLWAVTLGWLAVLLWWPSTNLYAGLERLLLR